MFSSYLVVTWLGRCAAHINQPGEPPQHDPHVDGVGEVHHIAPLLLRVATAPLSCQPRLIDVHGLKPLEIIRLLAIQGRLLM
jgi:hypothetical protein